jgi:hypothetical protein
MITITLLTDILGMMMSSNTDLLERAYELLETIGDSDIDLTIKINEAIHSNDLEALLFILNSYSS